MLAPKLRVLLLAAAMAAFSACSSSEGEDTGSAEADVTSAKIKINQTRSFTGSFGLFTELGMADLAFKVSNIDWQTHTATWEMVVVSGNGFSNPGAVPAKIRMMDCPGCFTFEVEEQGGTVVELEVLNSKMSELIYWGLHAMSPKVKTTSNAVEPPTGACSLVCADQVVSCKANLASASCNTASFTPLPSCTYGFAFKAGLPCPAP